MTTELQPNEKKKISCEEIFKTKENFTNYVENHLSEIIPEKLQKAGYYHMAELTQNEKTLYDLIEAASVCKMHNIIWIVKNVKCNLLSSVIWLNNHFEFGGIYVIKAKEWLNNELDFEVIAKPFDNIKIKKPRSKDNYAAQLQLKYWQTFQNFLNEQKETDVLKLNPKPQHHQYVKIGMTGVWINLLVNTTKNNVAVELLISDNKDLYKKIEKHRKKIDKLLQPLEWVENPFKKSSYIRKTIDVDINDEKTWNDAILQQFSTLIYFKETFMEYLKTDDKSEQPKEE